MEQLKLELNLENNYKGYLDVLDGKLYVTNTGATTVKCAFVETGFDGNVKLHIKMNFNVAKPETWFIEHIDIAGNIHTSVINKVIRESKRKIFMNSIQDMLGK